MKTFFQFLENQSQPPQGTPITITQRNVPVGGGRGGGGWKIHLRTGTNDCWRSICYNRVLEIIKANGNKWNSKMLKGGEANEKDITIYCGPKIEAIRAAFAIMNYEELYDRLLPPGKEILQDDILIHKDAPNIYGRFEASTLNTEPFEFHQYGCKGWSMLKSDVEKRMSSRYRKNKGMPYEEFDSESACQKAYKVLEKLFGKDFTG